MKYPLAVFAPCLGVRSETFVRRHVQDLLPGGTVAIGRMTAKGDWAALGPSICVQRCEKTLEGQLRKRFQRFGWNVHDMDRVSMRRFLRKHGVQVIMGEFLDKSLPLIDVAKDLGIPLFAHAHGYDVSMRLSDPEMVRSYLRYNDTAGIITMSYASRDRLISIGLDPRKVWVVYSGVDVPDDPVNPKRRETIKCIAVGRMVGKKGPVLTLDAFRRAYEQDPRLRLDYIGDGPLYSAADQFVKAFALSEVVKLHGGKPSSEVRTFMRDADIYIQHSLVDVVDGDEEGLPVAILEAMSVGLPVVSTFHAGIAEAVSDGTTGFLVREGDSTSMGSMILRLASDLELRRGMGKAGRERVLEKFTWVRERQQLLQVLGLHRNE